MLHAHTHTPQELWALGYTSIQLPIIPPGAVPAPRSGLDRMLKRRKPGDPDPRGKMPGIADSAGRWHGFPGWQKHQATEAEIASWAASGAGTGLRLGQCGEHHLAFIDSDTMDAVLSALIDTTITGFLIAHNLPPAPRRIGRDPRSGYLIRVSKAESKSAIRFGTEKVEVLGLGQQFVAIGIHPITKQPYYWPVQLVPIDELPLLTPELLQELREKLIEVLPEAVFTKDERERGGERTIDPASLRGNIERVRLAVKTIPNTKDIDRDQWLKILYAIRGACADINDAIEIAQEFSARWQHPDGNDPDYVTFTITGLADPHVGAAYLYGLAQDADPLAFNANQATGDDLNEQFGDWTDEERQEAKASADELHVWTLKELRNVPRLKYLIDGLIPQSSVGLLVGDTQTFKSFIALSMAMAISAGAKDWNGHAIDAPDDAITLYIAGEGGPESAAKRIEAWVQFYGYTPETLRDNFRLITASVDLMSKRSYDKIVAACRKQLSRSDKARLALIVLDTINTTAPGIEENSTKETGILHAICRKLGRTFSAAVLGAHHVNKQGGIRGANLLPQNADFLFSLYRDPRTLPTMIVQLEIGKMKDEAVGRIEHYHLDLVALSDGTTSLVPIIMGAVDAEKHETLATGRPSSKRDAILDMLKKSQDGETMADLCLLLEATTRKDRRAVAEALRRMRGHKMVWKDKSKWKIV